MNKSKVILAVIAGVAIGTVIGLALKNSDRIEDESIAPTEQETSALDLIAQQFSDKISTQLEVAERKIKSAVNKEINRLNPESELGLFL